MSLPAFLATSPFHAAALAMALWMVLAPQVPQWRERRGALHWLTWIASRGGCAAWIAGGAGRATGAMWAALSGAAHFGEAPGGHALAVSGAIDRGAGPWVALALIAADFAAWRAVAAADGEGGEAEWLWVASPVVLAFGVALAVPRSAAAALVAIALAFERRGRSGLAGASLGVAAVWGGPLAAAAAAAVLCAPGRRGVRGVSALGAAAATLAVLALAAPAGWAWTWAPPSDAGAGVTLWRLGLAFWGRSPGTWAWLACAVVGGWGIFRLAARGAGAPEMSAWTFASCAVLAPSFPAASALCFAPAMVAWAAANPDRRGWWVLFGAALSFGVGLEGGFNGRFGAGGWSVASIACAGTALLAAWPLADLYGPPARAARTTEPRAH